MGGGNSLNLIRINSINEYKNIIQESTLNSNITKSNFSTWHHIWSNLIELFRTFTNIDVGHLNQDNNYENSNSIYWNENSGYSKANINKVDTTYLYTAVVSWDCTIHGGACFRPIIEFKE